jgi:hypothetical protein
MTDAIALIKPEAGLDVHLEVRDPMLRRWRLAAKFEYGIHAMEAARALSEADTREWRVVDTRWKEGPMIITYTKGTAS